MKKRFIIFATVIIAAATTITVVSCKKDKTDENNANQNVSLTDSGKNDNMDDYLLSFKEKLLNAKNNDETISLEQAQRDLANLLNFDFGDANYATDMIEYDTLYAKFSMDQDEVDLYQLGIAYQSLFNQVVETYQQIDLPDKSVYTIHCYFDHFSSQETVKVMAIMGTRSYSGTRDVYLDWRAGNNAGTCEGITQYGAPEQVVALLRANLGSYACSNGGRVYFTDETNAFKEAIESDMLDPDAPRGSKLFFIHSSNPNANLGHTCIPCDEIMYYYNQARFLRQTHGSTFHPNPIPSNHVVTDYLITFMEGVPFNGISAWWKLTIYHAKPNCTDSSTPFV